MAFRNNQQPAPAEHPDEYGGGGSRKRPRPQDLHSADPMMGAETAFHQEDGEEDDEEDDEDKSKDKKAGRRKIKIEFIQDKSRRHITFSKRKAGIMKKAYELSTLTGTQVLLLVVSETGLVYTFTTAKLQPLVTQPEGKNLIQACLNAPHGQLPSSMPVGTPIGRSASGPAGTSGGGAHARSASGSSAPPPPPQSHGLPMPGTNVVGGLAIGGGSKDSEDGDEDDAPESASPVMSAASGNKRGGAADAPMASSTRSRRAPPNSQPPSAPPPVQQRKSTGGSPPQPPSSIGNHGGSDIPLTSPSMAAAIPQSNSQQSQQGSSGYAPHGHHSAPQHGGPTGYGNQQSSPMLHSGGGSQGGLPPNDAYAHPSMMQPYHLPPGAQGGNMHWGHVPPPGSYHRR